MKEPKDMTDIELNEAVAREVMGIALSDGKECHVCGGRGEYVQRRLSTSQRGTMQPCRTCRGTKKTGRVTPKPYSTSIADAWEVVEKMRANGWHFVIEANTVPELVVKVYRAGEEAHYSPTRIVSAPRAICLAALAALSAVRAKEKV